MATIESAKKGSKHYRNLLTCLGALLGVLLPLLSLLARSYFSGRTEMTWLREELRAYYAYHRYVFIVTPMVLASIGFYIGHLRDKITALQTSSEGVEATFRGRSITDELTGLYSRAHLFTEIDREVERATRYKRQLSVMAIDIDRFKATNDKFGRLIGDYILKEVSMLLSRGVRNIDIVGRYGPDEFLVILPEASNESARIVVERVQKEIEAHKFVTEKGVLPISISAAIASFRDPEEVDRRSLVMRLDRALLEAKRLGQKSVVAADA